MSNILTQLAQLSGGAGKGATISQTGKTVDGRPFKVSAGFAAPKGYGDADIVSAIRGTSAVVLKTTVKATDDKDDSRRLVDKKIYPGSAVVGAVAGMFGIDAEKYPALTAGDTITMNPAALPGTTA